MRITWIERAEFLRARDAEIDRERPGERYVLAAEVAGVLLLLRGLVELGNNPNRPSWVLSVLLAMGVGFLVAFALPLFLRWASRNVIIVSEKGVNRNTIGKGAHIEFWPWEEIGWVSLRTDLVNGTEFPLLVLYDPDGEMLARFGRRDAPNED